MLALKRLDQFRAVEVCVVDEHPHLVVRELHNEIAYGSTPVRERNAYRENDENSNEPHLAGHRLAR